MSSRAGRGSFAALGLNAVGALVIAASTVLANRQAELSDQLGWLSLACAGLLLALGADVGVLLGHRRRLAVRRRMLVPAALPGPVHDDLVTDGLERVVVAGGTRAHLRSCLFVAGKQLSPAGAGAGSCGACGS